MASKALMIRGDRLRPSVRESSKEKGRLTAASFGAIRGAYSGSATAKVTLLISARARTSRTLITRS